MAISEYGSTAQSVLRRFFIRAIYSGLTLNQDKARQRRTGLKLIHYNPQYSQQVV